MIDHFEQGPVSSAQSRVLQHLAAEQRSTISVREDRDLLERLTARPRELLSDMARKRLLLRLEPGRYVVAPWGADSLEQAAPFNVMLDSYMSARGPYYLGFLSAVIEHRLTDLDSWDVYVAVSEAATATPAGLELAGRPVRVTRISGQQRWVGLEEVRSTRREYYWRSTLERTLVDTLYRPRLCGDIELIMSAWARGHARENMDLVAVCTYARSLSEAVARRVGYVLSELGYRHLAAEHLGHLRGRSNQVLLDAGKSFIEGPWVRSSEWGVTINLPERSLRGWLNPM